MKLNKLALITATFGILGASLTGCKNKKAGGADKVQIIAYNAGYGIDWLNELITKFNETFKKEGKSAELIEANSEVGTDAEVAIQTPKKNQNDLYFLGNGNVSNHIAASYSKLHSSKTVLLEDLTDVYNSKAINFDGKEEEQTIADRMFDGYKEYCTYNGHVAKWQGNMYELPWADGVLGILCNPSVLAKYGLDIPLTSDELVNVVNQISTHTATDKVYPFVYAGQNASGYWNYLYETWLAQYEGVESYNKFIKCEPESGDVATNGYEVFKKAGIEKALDGMFGILQDGYVSNASKEYQHIDAQNEFIRGKAAFIVDGDWVLNEMKNNETEFNLTKDTIMIKTPILSSIGTKLGLTDVQLHNLVAGIDDHKTESELMGQGFSKDQIAKVYEARTTHDSLGTTHDILIPSYADAKETAKLFVRFLYSNDGCNIFRKYANSNLPLSYTRDESIGDTAFQRSIDAIYNYDDIHMISGDGELNDVRKLCNIYLFNVQSWSSPTTFKTILSNPSKFSASKMAQDEATYMETNWGAYMEVGGF